MAQMEPSVWRFALYVLALLAYLLISGLVNHALARRIAQSRSHKPAFHAGARTVLLLASGLAYMATFWTLTGDPQVIVLGALLAAHFLLAGLVALASLFMVRDMDAPEARILWHMAELQAVHPNLSWWATALPQVIGLLVPVVLGMAYFGLRWAEQAWAQFVWLVLLLEIVVSNLLVSQPRAASLVLNRNLGDATRGRAFLAMLSGSVWIVLGAALFAWAFLPVLIPAGAWQGAVAMIGVAVALAYLLAAVVLPYVIGHYRHLAWTGRLRRRREKLIARVVRATETARRETARERLEEARAELVRELKSLREDRGFLYALDLVEDPEKRNWPLRSILETSVPYDPRFQQVEALGQIHETIGEALEGLADPVADWRAALKPVESAVARVGSVPLEGKGRPWVLAAITVVFGFLLTPILVELRDLAYARLGIIAAAE